MFGNFMAGAAAGSNAAARATAAATAAAGHGPGYLAVQFGETELLMPDGKATEMLGNVINTVRSDLKKSEGFSSKVDGGNVLFSFKTPVGAAPITSSAFVYQNTIYLPVDVVFALNMSKFKNDLMGMGAVLSGAGNAAADINNLLVQSGGYRRGRGSRTHNGRKHRKSHRKNRNNRKTRR